VPLLAMEEAVFLLNSTTAPDTHAVSNEAVPLWRVQVSPPHKLATLFPAPALAHGLPHLPKAFSQTRGIPRVVRVIGCRADKVVGAECSSEPFLKAADTEEEVLVPE
jgi:hypothetical protein